MIYVCVHGKRELFSPLPVATSLNENELERSDANNKYENEG